MFSFNLLKDNFLKLVALFTVIRGYNVFMLILAMYLTAYFIFSDGIDLTTFLEGRKIHFMVMASAFTVSAGYIINNFYDLEKDRVSRPISVYVSRFISQDFKLTVYLFLNLVGLIFAYLVSWRVLIFFFVFQFLVWLYSHKINKWVLVNNLFSTLLAIMPFLALSLHYNNYSPIVFMHGAFLSLLLLISDIVKDLSSYKADMIYNYNTLPTNFGRTFTKYVVLFCIILLAFFAYTLSLKPEVGNMKWYFYVALSALPFAILFLFWNKKSWQYKLLNFYFKALLGLGVISIAWIKINPLDIQKFF